MRRARCFLLLAAFLWGGALAALADPLKTCVWGLDDPPPGCSSPEALQPPANAMGFDEGNYETASGLSKFLNADPSGFGGGLNMYQFCDGNPISLTDPFGLGAQGDNGSGFSWIGHFTPGSFGPLSSVPGPYSYFDGTGVASGVAAEGLNLASTLGNEFSQVGNAALTTIGTLGNALNGFADYAGVPGFFTAIAPEMGGLSAAEDGTAALQPMADAAYQTGTTRIVAGYEVGGNAGLVGNTYNVNIWALYQTSNPQGPFALVNALSAEASAAGASQISIVGSAITPTSTLQGLTPGIAGRLGLQFQQISPTTILLQGAVH